MKKENLDKTICKKIGQTLFALLILTTPLMQGGAIFQYHQTVIVFFSLVLTGLLLIDKGLGGNGNFPSLGVTRTILALVLLVFISAGRSQVPDETQEGIILFLAYLGIFYSSIYFFSAREEQRVLVYFIISAGLLLSFIALAKPTSLSLQAWYPNERFSKEMLTGPYNNHNHLAGYLEMVIPLIFSLFFIKTRRGWSKLLLISIGALVTLVHIGTLSRGGWISLALGLFFMIVMLISNKSSRNKRFIIYLAVTSVAIVVFIISSSSAFQRALTVADDVSVESFSGRMIAWQGTLNMIKEFPLTGSGPGTYSTVFQGYQPPGMPYKFYYAHNDYLQFVSDVGGGLIPLLFMLFYFVGKEVAIRFKSKSRQRWGLAIGSIASIVTILIHSLVDFNLHIPSNALLFLLIVAMLSSPVVDQTRVLSLKEDH